MLETPQQAAERAKQETLIKEQAAAKQRFDKIIQSIKEEGGSRPPLFRKAVSVLNSRATILRATMNLPIYPPSGNINEPRNEFEWELFEIPYNNIKSFNLDTKGGTSNVTLTLVDNSFVTLRTLMYKIKSISQFGDFAGSIIVNITWGWAKDSSTSISKEGNRPQPLYESTSTMQLKDVKLDSDLNMETYTLECVTLESPAGKHSMFWKPFNFFGPKPIVQLGWQNLYNIVNKFISEVDSNTSASYLDKLKKISSSNNSAEIKRLESELNSGSLKKANDFLEILNKNYGITDLNTRQNILRDIEALRSSSAELSSKFEDGLPSNSSASFEEIGNESAIFQIIQKMKVDKTIDIFRDPKRSKLVNAALPVISETSTNPFFALMSLLKAMKIQNDEVNETSREKNKLILVSFLDIEKIENFKLKVSNGKIPESEFNKIQNREIPAQHPVEDTLKVGSIVVNKYSSWKNLLNDVAAKITISPGETPKDRTAKKESEDSTESQNPKSVQVFMSTYRTDMESKELDAVANIISLMYDLSNPNSKEEAKGIANKIIKKIQDAKQKFNYVTFVFLSEKNLGTLFNSSSWKNNIIQSYTFRPIKQKGAKIFPAGVLDLNDEGFPCVISFKPEMNFNATLNSIISGLSHTRSTQTGRADIVDKSDTTKTQRNIDAQRLRQSININDIQAVTQNINVPPNGASLDALEFKRQQNSFRKLIAIEAMGNQTAELQIIGEPGFNEKTIIAGTSQILFRHYDPNGIDTEFTGIWTIVRAVQNISDGKFVTTLSLVKNQIDGFDPFNNQIYIKNSTETSIEERKN